MDQAADTIWIAEQAKGIGFDLCGVVRAEKFPELENTKDWLKRGYAGEMNYLFDPRREDPRGAMPGVQRSEEHTSELQSHSELVCSLLLEKKKERRRCRGMA